MPGKSTNITVLGQYLASWYPATGYFNGSECEDFGPQFLIDGGEGGDWPMKTISAPPIGQWLTTLGNGYVSAEFGTVAIHTWTDTEITATVKTGANDPAQTACVGTVGDPTGDLGYWGIYWGQLGTWTASACRNVGGFPIQIGCPTPTITSVTPLGWWAGQTQAITITGTGFLKASDPGGPTKLTITASGVTLTNPVVVSDTQITAKVDITKKTPAETVTLTVTNSSGSGTPQTATASPAPVVLPVPVIQWLSKTISGDDAKTQKVQVGQPVELTSTPASLPGGFTVSKSTWNVDGTTIKQYNEDDDTGISLEETDLDKQNTTFYWLYPDDSLNVTYDYCATDPNGNQICTSPQAQATFHATSLTMSLSTWDSKEATIENLNLCTMNNTTAPYLGYGDLSGPAPGCPGQQSGTVGIRLPASGESAGKYVFVQVINADFSTYTQQAPSGGGPTLPPYICGPHAGLDKAYPFPGVYPKSPWIAYDGPQIPLPPTYATGTRNFYASMYLLWQPDQLSGTSTKSIPVPIGYQDWQFIATAIQKPPIGKDRWRTDRTPTASGDYGGGFVPATPYDNAIYGYPQWSYIVSTDCGVSQTIDAESLNKYSLWNGIANTGHSMSEEEQ